MRHEIKIQLNPANGSVFWGILGRRILGKRIPEDGGIWPCLPYFESDVLSITLMLLKLVTCSPGSPRYLLPS